MIQIKINYLRFGAWHQNASNDPQQSVIKRPFLAGG